MKSLKPEALIEHICGAIVIGDKGYDSNAFVNLKPKNVLALLHLKENRLNPRDYDEHWYKEGISLNVFLVKSSISEGFSLGLIKQPLPSYLSFISF